jgi:hypothetical protein
VDPALLSVPASLTLPRRSYFNNSWRWAVSAEPAGDVLLPWLCVALVEPAGDMLRPQSGEGWAEEKQPAWEAPP